MAEKDFGMDTVHQHHDDGSDHGKKEVETVVTKGNEAFAEALLKEPPSAWTQAQIFLYMFSIIGFFCSTMNGYDGSLINNLLQNPYFKAAYNVDSSGVWTGIVSSMYQIGGVVALPFVGPAIDTWGRRFGMFIGAMTIVVGTIIQGVSHSRGQFMGGRFLLGFGVSIAAAAGPMYVVEINHPAYRGRVGAMYNTLWFSGAIVASGAARGALDIHSDASWRLITWLQADTQNPLLGETSCTFLLQQLQEIWDEVGETDEERDKMLLQIDQECLDVYKRKVDQAVKSRAHLLQALEDAKIEFSRLLSALGEKTYDGIPEKNSGSIKEQLAAIAPALEKLWKQKDDRAKEFLDVQSQIDKISSEIAGTSDQVESPKIDESDLSLIKLDQFHAQLQDLQNEKSERLHKVLEFVNTIHDLCAVLGIDFFSTVTEVHPSLNDSTGIQSKSISNDTLSSLARTVLALEEDKKQRLQKLQEFATQLIDLWNLMDTTEEERNLFDHVTCNISASVDEVSIPGALALDLIEQAEVEVERLDQLKASRMKEIAFKKQAVLEEIFSCAHIEIDSQAAQHKIVALIDSGNIEPAELLADMDNQIEKAKEEAHSRKEILDKVEKWMAACEEESWLEDYNRDQNRYNASRGAHLNLKRAEKARILVSKIPALVESLIAKTRAWEQDCDTTFRYDGVPLLAMLDEYMMLRHDREEEKRRFRDQKKFHEQIKEPETPFGSTPTAARPLGTKKVVGPRANGSGNRRLSLNSHQNGSRSTTKDGKRDHLRTVTPVNYVAMSKDDTASRVSGTEHIPSTP